MRAILACVLLMGGQILALSQPPESGGSLSLASYISELDRLVSALERAGAADAETLSSTVPLRWHVQTGNRLTTVDGTWLIHGLRAVPDTPQHWIAHRDRLRRRLAEMRAHAAEQLAAAPLGPSSANVRGAVDEILTRPEFRRGLAADRLESVWQQIADWIRSMFERAGVGRLASRDTATFLAWIAAFAAFVGLGLWLARMLDRPGSAVRIGLEQPEGRRLSPRDWARQALAAARAGDVREAVRCAYNCAIRRVEEQGTWRLDESRTPREYLRLLPADDARRAPVQDLTDQFEQIWYGNRTAGEDDVRRATMNLERLGCLPAERPI